MYSRYTRHADALLCLQLHTVRSPYTVHACDQCWCLAVPTAAHCTVSIHSACLWPMLMSCCAYSCTLYGLHTQCMLVTNADVLLCLQLHTVVYWCFSPFSSFYLAHPRTVCELITRHANLFRVSALLPFGVATSHNGISSRLFEICQCFVNKWLGSSLVNATGRCQSLCCLSQSETSLK
jgi:hypothetical protein